MKVPVAPSFARHLPFFTRVFIAAVYMFCTVMAVIFVRVKYKKCYNVFRDLDIPFGLFQL